MKLASRTVLSLACCCGAPFAYGPILVIAAWRHPLGAAKAAITGTVFALLLVACFGYCVGT